jgi:hypothetical protein
VKTAVEAVGVNASFLGSGTLRTALVKILGTDNFYWENDAIIMVDGAKQIKIGQYRNGDYGIAVSTDGGVTWQTAIDFDGLHGGGGETIIYQDTITKAELAPLNPSVNDLWVDTIENRLKLWNGTEWVNIGYEPTTPPDPDEGGSEGGGDDPTDPVDPGTDDPTDPENPSDDGGGENEGGNDGGSGDNPGTDEENPGGETPEEGGS